MARAFHLRKSYRNEGVVCLVFFLLIGVVSSGAWLMIAPPGRRMIALCPAVFFALFWGFWVCLSCWILLAYRLGQLRVGNRQVIQKGVIGRKEIDLASIAVVRWRIFQTGGSISLRTLTKRLTIHLDKFERDERLWLIRYFHNKLPEAVEENWSLFCSKVAISLRDQVVQHNGCHDPGKVVLTRRRWDWYLVPVILLSAIYGVVACWQFQHPRMLMAPLMPTLFWLYLRCSTPRKGLAGKRISAVPGQASFLIFCLWWGAVAVAGLVVFTIWRPPMPHAAILGSIAMAFWVAVFLWRGHQLDGERVKRDQANAIVAVQQWDEGETGA